MRRIVRDQKGFWSGLIFIAFGLTAVIISQDYPMGRAGRMGPGYFPTVLGGLLALLGLIAVVRSLTRPGEALERFAVREAGLILGATVLFGVLVRGAGLAMAIVAVVMVSGYASIKFKVGPFLAVAAGLAIVCALVFVKALGLPMPIVGPWFGF